MERHLVPDGNACKRRGWQMQMSARASGGSKAAGSALQRAAAVRWGSPGIDRTLRSSLCCCCVHSCAINCKPRNLPPHLASPPCCAGLGTIPSSLRSGSPQKQVVSRCRSPARPTQRPTHSLRSPSSSSAPDGGANVAAGGPDRGGRCCHGARTAAGRRRCRRRRGEPTPVSAYAAQLGGLGGLDFCSHGSWLPGHAGSSQPQKHAAPTDVCRRRRRCPSPHPSRCCSFAIVQPMADRSRLEVQEEGLEVLRSIKGSVCPVAVIGPYRSGKVGQAAEEGKGQRLACTPMPPLSSTPAAGPAARPCPTPPTLPGHSPTLRRASP